ncbi:TetR/AcrR family transcriptional regulator [Nocardia cyriacigeorgica]|uniref:TetR/AcrR family transcriptional regulator n=1 Tax=Nocardia cyriacigeorgica TaxID=135487 RepID=A0A6P1DGX9_9NOCA|nr:TetR family transcriptional regulator [Nocardia cyriacigeorgica]NEW37863.1 TetR/AcrR family transcriptional regulator [Nocardia cyriacigeorgica]NEW47990.1 TetR/AcrR family transcriptional regulator [Nocardia cyriacigeorgica]NEW48753.1 TetR/AcrR family transcriptional regulator [Nocardia cyriacigeorgica]NEW58255.1 TetR/AcrR family transcriptional regulator [Nocardia cyriacigeorgica]
MSRADATKARILQAATDEFATYGIAGARVDRIAKTAAANKNLIYIYFCNKEQLFDAVLDAHVTHGLNSVPFTPDDLPEYAGRIFDYCQQHPEVIRLATWQRLERGDRDPAGTSPPREAKLEALAAVQKEGGPGSDFSPTALLTFVLSIALAWNPSNATSMPASATESTDDRRRAIVEAVRRLL